MSVARKLVEAKKLKEDPVGFVLDTVVGIFINLVIPLPLAKTLVQEFRGAVIGFLFGFIALGLFLIITVGTLLMSPSLITSGFFGQLLSVVTPDTTELASAQFPLSSIPTRSPLGGSGMHYTTITAGFMDPQYFLNFGKNHFGIDIVPSSAYYQESEVYLERKKVIVYATHNGKVTAYTDSHGGQTVELINSEGNLKTLYVHFKHTFVKSGDTITAGTPIGEMGRTGKATGEHVHYEVIIKDGNSWRAVNPLTYIR